MTTRTANRITDDESAIRFIREHAGSQPEIINGHIRESRACARCGGTGNGGWLRDGGVCYECHGRYTLNQFADIPVKAWAQRLKRQVQAAEKRRAKAAANAEHQITGQRDWCERNGHGRITFAELDQKRAAEREAARVLAPDCPIGKEQITGTIIKTAVVESHFGTQYKMTVKDDRGFIVWGSIPGNLQLFDTTEQHPADETGEAWTETIQRGLRKGDRVTFKATVTRSDMDAKFGFFKRPTQSELITGSEP